MMWFRIELHKDGAIKSCSPVEGSFRSGRYVRYVESDSQTDAIRLVMSWWKAAEHDRKRRKKNIEAGLCPCGRERADGRKYCNSCLESASKSQLRRKNGERKRRRPNATTNTERAARTRRVAAFSHPSYRKLGTLRELLAMYDASPFAFRSSLVVMIEELEAEHRRRLEAIDADIEAAAAQAAE